MENSIAFLTETIGTMILIILGNGIVANVVLKDTKGNNAGWISITCGWALAVTIGATISSALGGVAHLNPAVTIAFVVNGWTESGLAWSTLPLILLGQVAGAILGQIIVDIFYFKHITHTVSEDNKAVLAMHATSPEKRCIFSNLFSEFVGTAVLVTAIFVATSKDWFTVSWMGPIFVGVTVFAIGLSLGGTTGYAINPIRDLAPRVVHQLLPIKNKVKSDWQYSWIPVVGPILAGLTIGAIFLI